MSGKVAFGLVLVATTMSLAGLVAWSPAAVPAESLEARFTADVRPFLERYCYSCHGVKKPRAGLDLTPDSTISAIAGNTRRWEQVLQRLAAQEMPPEDAPRQPGEKERTAVIGWLRELIDREAQRTSGDPGIVLARRLSNAELDDTIRDLTGVDIRPARELPVDPANEAGFDNSGESLTMSPALLKKYLAAARHVADHVVLRPEGFVFAPHPAVTDTDRDKYCVQRILAFYDRHKVDLADYFLAAWKYRKREALGKPTMTLERLAADAGLSAKYLSQVWSALDDSGSDAGPLAAVRRAFHEVRGPQVRPGCEQVRDLVLRVRRQLEPKVRKVKAPGISEGSQPLVLWNDRLRAQQHRAYSGDVFADLARLGGQVKGKGADLEKLFAVKDGDTATQKRFRAELDRFCALFPDAFVVTDRGPYFDPKAANQGRPLTAGFHLMQGYFRDDEPLCELILDERQRRELDALWDELNFVTLVPMRQYRDFIFFERAEPPRYMREAQFDFARSEDKDAVSQAKMDRLAKAYLGKARKLGAGGEAIEAIETYFTSMSAEIRRVERARLAAEPSHLDALVKFNERAYRRPLSVAERDDVRAFYQQLRRRDGLGHEDALRDTLTSVLLSPHFLFRVDLAQPGTDTRPLTDHELASRLSYFLWSSMPDTQLLARATAGELHKPEVLIPQARRMLRDPRARGLATEFAGNWLDFRRFEEHNAVDRQRFTSFTNELRQAMFEEPVRYLLDIAQRNRPVLDLLYGNDTFVSRPLARHYGMPEPPRAVSSSTEREGPSHFPLAPKGSEGEGWAHIEDARRFGRGGLLPMAVFLTKNAPGLRTSPVKRGYWVVRRLLGEQVPPPPPTVPELPKDEANLGELTLPQVLARHRADRACAGCHRRFDSIGLAFEGFGPIGERRTKDLGGRPVEAAATYPDGKERTGLDGLRDYLRDKRQDDFVDNLCKKLFSYALGRSLMLSDRKALDAMKARLAADHYAFASLIESIVTTPQFLTKRGRDDRRAP